MLKSLGLSSSVDSYTYLGKGAKPALSDKEGYREVQKALTAIGFSAELQNTLHSLVAAILLLGQVEFEPKGEHSTVKDSATVAAVAARLGTDAETLVKALTYRVVAARGEVAYSELNAERATYSRDALAKALYNELFMVRGSSECVCARAFARV
jgi:myosin-1